MYYMLHLPTSLRRGKMAKSVLRKDSDIFPVFLPKMKNNAKEKKDCSEVSAE